MNDRIDPLIIVWNNPCHTEAALLLLYEAIVPNLKPLRS